MFKHLARSPPFNDASFIHKEQPIPHFTGKPHLMCDNHHRHALLCKCPHNIKHLADHLWIKRGCRLIKEHHFRMHSECLRIARQLLLDINRLGMPAASEFLDVISPQYIGDLISWGAIGARTTESQVHRELASGLSAPIGFKNGTDGNVKIAIDAVQAASRGHHFLSVGKSGQVAIVHTQGNPDCHLILRGGKQPNYDDASVQAACQQLAAAGLPETLMVDCSHANSSKQYEKQLDVAHDLARQISAGSRRISGVMLESNLRAGAQKFTPGQDDPATLEYGQSITDACLGWDDSEALINVLAEAVQARRARA